MHALTRLLHLKKLPSLLKHTSITQHVFTKLHALSLVQLLITATGTLAAVTILVSLYVNLGLYRPSLALETKIIESTDTPFIYRYSLTGDSLLEKKGLSSSPGGWAQLFINDGQQFSKQSSIEELSANPGNGFFVTPSALYFKTAQGNTPKTEGVRYTFSRPLQANWPITVLALYFALVAVTLFRFTSSYKERWVLIHDLVLISLFFSLLWSTFQAPGGFFVNSLGGNIDLWRDDDPGGWYIASAHELGRNPIVFAGHPAIPMQIGLWIIQKVVRFFANSSFSYSEAIAANIFYVQVLSKTMCSLAFIGASLILCKIGTLLFNNRFIGVMASLLFSTSFFSVFYMTKVSTEGFTVLFFLLSFLFVLMAHQHSSNPRSVSMFAFLACFFSVFAFYSKIHLMGALPFFVLTCLIVIHFRTLRWRPLLTMGAAGLLGMIAAWLCLEPFMDWTSFNSIWAPFGLVEDTNTSAWNRYYHTIFAVAKSALDLAAQITNENTLPITTPKRLSFEFGSTAALLFVISFCWPTVRRNIVFSALSLYGIFTIIIFFYKGFAFHYLFPFLAVASISSAFVIHQITEKNTDGSPARHGLFAFLLVFLLNIDGFRVAMNSHSHREQSNSDSLPIYAALSRLSPGETLGDKGLLSIPKLVGVFTQDTYNLGAPSKLVEALSQFEILPKIVPQR
jgi:hypothetical protein